MKRLLLFLLISGSFLYSLSAQADSSKDYMHLSIDTGIMVFDRRAAADVLGDWAEASGGYFTWKSDETVVLRVPDEAAEDFRSYVEEISDGVLHYGRATIDLRQEMLGATSALEAREEILGRNVELLDTASVEGTLELETEIRRLMSEIDSSRGLLNRLENDAAMSRINVMLSFRSQTVPDHRPSSFDWINGVDFYNFISGYPRYDEKRISGNPITVPEGFAEIDMSKSFAAISPEGLRLRISRIDNYPEQAAEFWFSALEHDLKGRGYLPVSDRGLPEWSESEPFESLLWALPMGEDDYLYLVALRVKGKNIEILEMAGEAEEMDQYLK